MAQKKVVWTRVAAKQRRSVLNYWAEHNGSDEYPIKLMAMIRSRTNGISQFPNAGKRAEHPDTRVVSMGHFSIYYRVEKEVIITAFWDNRQDPEKLLKSLKQAR